MCFGCWGLHHDTQSLALVFTFGSSRPGAQSLILTLLCFLFTVAHCILRPMRTTEEQTLQAILLSTLTLVALSCTVTSTGSGSARLDAGTTVFAQRIQLTFGVAVPLAAFAWAQMWSRVGQTTAALRRMGLRSARRAVPVPPSVVPLSSA